MVNFDRVLSWVVVASSLCNWGNGYKNSGSDLVFFEFCVRESSLTAKLCRPEASSPSCPVELVDKNRKQSDSSISDGR